LMGMPFRWIRAPGWNIMRPCVQKTESNS